MFVDVFLTCVSFSLSFCRLVAVNKNQSTAPGFSVKPKGRFDNAAGILFVFCFNFQECSASIPMKEAFFSVRYMYYAQ